MNADGSAAGNSDTITASLQPTNWSKKMELAFGMAPAVAQVTISKKRYASLRQIPAKANFASPFASKICISIPSTPRILASKH